MKLRPYSLGPRRKPVEPLTISMLVNTLRAVLQVGDTITNAKVIEGQDYLVEPKGGPSSA